MGNYSVYCEKIDLTSLVTENNGNVELTSPGVEKAELFSEGNKYLFGALAACWKHGIKTFACCSGHTENENANYFPYIGIVLDNNSLPYIRNIIANLQKKDDIKMSIRLVRKEDTWGNNEPDLYKSFCVYCGLPNRDEIFYRIYEAIEAKNIEKIPLSYNDKIGVCASVFYDKVSDFATKEITTEEDKKFSGLDYYNYSPELSQFSEQVLWEKSKWQKIKETAIVRSIIEIFNPKKREERVAMEKYKIPQEGYKPPLFSRLNNNYYNGQHPQPLQHNNLPQKDLLIEDPSSR